MTAVKRVGIVTRFLTPVVAIMSKNKALARGAVRASNSFGNLAETLHFHPWQRGKTLARVADLSGYQNFSDVVNAKGARIFGNSPTGMLKALLLGVPYTAFATGCKWLFDPEFCAPDKGRLSILFLSGGLLLFAYTVEGLAHSFAEALRPRINRAAAAHGLIGSGLVGAGLVLGGVISPLVGIPLGIASLAVGSFSYWIYSPSSPSPVALHIVKATLPD